jgi:two-component system, NtrC family, sensor histidine kinase PilS
VGPEAVQGQDPRGEKIRRRLTVLMAARLLLSVGVFGLALAVIGAGQEGAEIAEQGVYGTLAFAFLTTLAYAIALRVVRRVRRFAALQLATDVAIVSSIVLFSGGMDSPFSFLYVPITVYGAIFFDRRGGYGAAALSAAGYALALYGADALGVGEELRSRPPWEVMLVAWGVHTSALLLVALLAGALSRDLRLAGERLDARTSDLARLRRLHERTVESLTSGLLTLDREARITSFNPEAQRITGRRALDARGRMLEEVLPGASKLLVETGGGGRLRERLVFIDRAGERRHLGLASSILREEDGSPGGYVVIFQDVTDVVAMERDLRRSERLAGVGQLAADIAHEVRNPLAAISGCVEMLQAGLRGEEADQEPRRLMGIVLREIDRLNRLITDFLRYARPAPPKVERVALAPLVTEIVEMARGALREGVRIDASVPPGLAALADATQLRQALWNLMSNAEQALGETGTVQIGARSVGRPPQGPSSASRNESPGGSPGVEIEVADTGSGIAPEVLERIFDPFFTTKTGGTGLGLATVHRIVEGHGGVLQVESRVGAGTCFRIWLPCPEGER